MNVVTFYNKVTDYVMAQLLYMVTFNAHDFSTSGQG